MAYFEDDEENLRESRKSYRERAVPAVIELSRKRPGVCYYQSGSPYAEATEIFHLIPHILRPSLRPFLFPQRIPLQSTPSSPQTSITPWSHHQKNPQTKEKMRMFQSSWKPQRCRPLVDCRTLLPPLIFQKRVEWKS